MEEEWMRDRALLRDLLEKTPQASPQELAQAIGRSVSWVKKWRKRLAEGDPHDSSLLCSRSRAHHAPYFCWDIRVTLRIVEMRFSPPENLKRVPGPRALLYYLPRDPELQAAQVPLPRSSRTIWKILHTTGCLVPRSKEPPHPNELREPLEEIQMDARSMSARSHLNRARHPQAPACGRASATRVDAGTSIALSAQAREDFHEHTALEAVITFLQKSGRPRQMTFDRDPRLSLGVCQAGIFPRRCVGFCCAWASSPTSARHIAQTKMRDAGEIPQNLRARVFTHPSTEHASRGTRP
jgi:hypothetical protein